MNILIIGGAGFFGYSLAHFLSKKKMTIDIVDDFSRKTSTKDINILKKINI